MNASILPRLTLCGVASILLLAASAAIAQTDGAQSAPKPGTAVKSGEKPEGAKKTAKPAGPAGYATEADARAHCKGGVVWVDQDHFNHYPGSREYGRKPGAFACEKG